MITFIVRTYNSAECVLDCLRSVDSQTVDQWRCVIVDDGSDDDTVDLVKSFVDDDSRYVLLQHRVNSGPTQALVTGLDSCDTDWWAVVDSDDLLHPKAVETMRKYMESYPTPAFVYSSHNVQYSPGTSPVACSTANIPWDYGNLRSRFISQQLCVFNTLITKMAGWVDPTYRLAADYDLCLRMAEIGKVIKVPVRMYTKRLYFDNVSKSMRDIQIECCCRAVKESLQRENPSMDFKVTHSGGVFSWEVI